MPAIHISILAGRTPCIPFALEDVIWLWHLQRLRVSPVTHALLLRIYKMDTGSLSVWKPHCRRWSDFNDSLNKEEFMTPSLLNPSCLQASTMEWQIHARKAWRVEQVKTQRLGGQVLAT